MTPRDAVVRVLSGAGEPLHWTVIQDRALRAGLLDPFETRDVRRAVQSALRELTRDGVIRRHGKGVYALPSGDDGARTA